MSRYIDFYLIGDAVDSHGNVHYEDLCNIPSADVRENVYGEWIDVNMDEIKQCSRCFMFVKTPFAFSQNHKINYCPNCGADMKGGDRKNDKRRSS